MIVGTAGHIDHGKTALVRALTGIETDRLKDEKARGISIDLGFAYLPTESGTIGFVDVPGHDRFVRNMLAGATGIDAVLLVVAADDGVMPQTREHLDILDLLGLTRGIVAVTKCDLVPQERHTEVQRDIDTLLARTGLSGAPVIPVSSLSGQGIDDLRHHLVGLMHSFARDKDGLFRLSVDRCFSLPGAGTIVTGSVLSGAIHLGDTVMVSPMGLQARVRSIHAQSSSAESGSAGDRCALNLVGDGIGVDAIQRGDVILDPSAHAPAVRIDTTLRLLGSEVRPLAHWTPVHLHHGANEVSARIAVLEDGPIPPGERGWIQLVVDRPVAAAVGDRFIIRDTSGSRTLGGGRFVDLRGPSRRRRVPDRLAQLDALAHEDTGETLVMALGRWPWYVDIAAFARDRAMGPRQLEAILAKVPHERASAPNEALAFSPEVWERLSGSARDALAAFHQAHPQLLGPGAARLARGLEPRLPAKIGAAAVHSLVDKGTLASGAGAIRLPSHRLSLDRGDQRLWQRIAPHLSGDARFRPPRGKEFAGLLGERDFDIRRVLKAMARQRSVVELAPDHFFLSETVTEMAGIAADVAMAQEDGHFLAAQFRDRLKNGRKVAIQILEYFDRQGLTLRQGDVRRIVPHRMASFTGTPTPLAALSVRGRESPPVGRPDFKPG